MSPARKTDVYQSRSGILGKNEKGSGLQESCQDEGMHKSQMKRKEICRERQPEVRRVDMDLDSDTTSSSARNFFSIWTDALQSSIVNNPTHEEGGELSSACEYGCGTPRR
jgi:hypothetical protein